jgi:DNA-binding CsgD family transcriptional regulator
VRTQLQCAVPICLSRLSKRSLAPTTTSPGELTPAGACRRSRRLSKRSSDQARCPGADRARSELAATGENPGAREPAPVAQLTPQELQIALAVSEGRTNREVAEAPFLSSKTIEYHLRNVFPKLDMRSRTELGNVMRFATEGPGSHP